MSQKTTSEGVQQSIAEKLDEISRRRKPEQMSLLEIRAELEESAKIGKAGAERAGEIYHSVDWSKPKSPKKKKKHDQVTEIHSHLNRLSGRSNVLLQYYGARASELEGGQAQYLYDSITRNLTDVSTIQIEFVLKK